MDNNNMFKDSDLTINAQNIYGGIKSHEDGELHTLKEMLKRIEALEYENADIKYFLNNPRKLN
jgi:hypothetical protein|tara:strand:- start:562 stop:750 length:189 start_codon:yes stop_codon:yes gene_type:complete